MIVTTARSLQQFHSNSVHYIPRLTQHYKNDRITKQLSPAFRQYATEPKKSNKRLPDYRTLIGSSTLLALSIPAYFVLPGVVNWALVVLIPPHVAVGVKHVLSDYTKLNSSLISYAVAFIIFVALVRLTTSSVGLGGILVELFK
eukprot:TRINITY_DN3202_c1_g1_i2.p1 TRINITY_DN3202_c1_g1~~TRINITY_DN3202_c1_g1_i2.p1  ORF type:complete len:144 (+),score=20.88 TRINITY_DN3202_c1_g1_i2:92-523(+)